MQSCKWSGRIAGVDYREALHDLEAITRTLVPELHRRGVFRTSYEAGTLRGLLGLRRPANRYVARAEDQGAAARRRRPFVDPVAR